MSDPTPILTDASQLRRNVHEKALAAIRVAFPLESRGKRLEVEDLHVHEKHFSPDEQRRALLTGGSLHEAVKGTLVLKDAQGAVLDRAHNFTLVHLPYMTERHTLIADGNEYQVANQLRRKPGVYTSRADNGELRSIFNLGRGANFDVGFSPEKGTFHLEYGTTNISLYPILTALGVEHQAISDAWGKGVADANRAIHGKDGAREKAIAKLYAKLEHPSQVNNALEHAGKVEAVKKRYELTTIDPRVTEATLGKSYEKVTPSALIAAGRKILAVHEGRTPTDDTDALTFKTFHSIDDFVGERIRLSARAWAPKAKFALSTKTSIREALRPAPFSDALKRFVTTSNLTAVPTGINPLELIDHAVKVTSLGEGGIPSDRAIPFDARMIHNTHFGALDPIRTPESSHSGVDIRATIAAHRDAEGNLYTVLRNVKTDKNEFVKAGDQRKYVVAFPGEDLKGEVDAFVDGKIERIAGSKVTHQLMHTAHIYSPATSLIPGIHSIQGNRAIMGSKMGTQALPLLEREAPYVQVKSHLPGDVSFEAIYGHMVVPVAPVDGTIHKIEDGWIYIKPKKSPAKTAEDRATVERKTLGPFTFNIEIKKGVRRKGEGQASVKPTSADYGHLPGYVGPDGDSLDFFVGDHPDGALFSYEKQKRYDQPDWKTTDVKYVVGMNPAEEEAFHTNSLKWNTDKVRFANLTRFKDWDALKAHIDTHHKEPGAVKTAAKGDEDLVKVPYQTLFPFPSKTYLHHDLEVKPGDKVVAGQRLGESNFTRKGVLALGKNLRVSYMPYYGVNSNDAVVISEGASKKLTSEHMYREVFPLNATVELSKGKHQHYYGTKYTPGQYGVLDEHGVVRKGVTVHHKDPLILGVTKTQVIGTDAMLGRLSKSLSRPYQEVALTWEHGAPGEVVDVVRTPSQIVVLVRTREAMQVGDKLCYDEQTEMLTEEGWKPVAAVTHHDRVATRELTDDVSTMSFVRPSEVHSYSQGDDMIRVTTEHVDLFVTVEHHMVVRHTPGTWKRVRSCVLAGYSESLTIEYANQRGAFVVPKSAYEYVEGYKGRVFGVTVPSGVVYVRRNGKEVWSGNSGRYGNKGVVAKIIPDHEMLQDEKGRPIDLLLTSAGVVSRINPAQVIETAVGKVVEKTGKPILYDNNERKNAVEWASEMLKAHGIKDKEHLYDPVLKRTIKGPDKKGVLVGRQYIYKLFKSTDTNFAGHGVGPYDLNEQPLKTGGDDSAKGLGKMEFDALIAHNARNLLQEAASLKSQKNDEFWKAIQLGAPLPASKPTFAFNKFVGMLEGAGVKVDKRGSKFKLLPLTDKDVLARSRGAVENSKTLKAKNLHPETGGLFDPLLTGGPQGTLYSHIDLHEAMPHPVFKEPIRRLLGMTEKQFDAKLGEHGGEWFREQLRGINIPSRLAELRKRMVLAKGSELNDIVKQIKYLNACEKEGYKPHEAFITTKVPVVPPVFRPILPQPNDPSQLMVADANKLYGYLMDSNHTLKTTAVESDRGKHRLQVFNALGALYGTEDVENDELKGQSVKGFLSNIAGVGTPKGGFFQRKLMRRTQDVSGRGTAVPDANLGMDDVGIPEQMLWQMYDKLVIARLIRMGYPALDAKEKVLKKDHTAREALLAETRERPVLINRAPTLHRWSIVAANPRPVEGKTIRVSPFIEKGMNLDFDGDDQDSCVFVALRSKPTAGRSHNRASYLDYVITGVTVQPAEGPMLPLLEDSMAARFRTEIPTLVGADLVMCDLADFPHGEKISQKGHISFYSVPENVSILALDEATGALVEQHPSLWSQHEQRLREIVTLASDRQIFSDDDPRAVYGLNANLEYVRARPSDSVGIFVPVAHSGVMAQDGQTLDSIPSAEYAVPLALNERCGHLFGMLVGNGWTNAYQVCLSGLNAGVQQAFRDDLEGLFPRLKIEYHTYTHGSESGFGDSLATRATSDPGKAMVSYFKGVIGEGAPNKHLPAWFLRTSRAFRLGLLAGLIDTDGSISQSNAKAKNKPQWMVNYSSRSGRLAREIALLAKTLGLRAHVTAGPHGGATQYVVTFSTVELGMLGDMPLSHTEKRARYTTFLKDPPQPSSSYNATNAVPVPVSIAKKCSHFYGNGGSNYTKWWQSQKKGYVSRDLALSTLREHPELRESTDPLLQRWIAIVDSTSVRWDRVVGFEKTGIREDGYDLTVPGYETFMNVEGVILSNTLQVHVPVTVGAIEDAQHMKLSNMLLSDQTRNKILAFPQHEAIMGFTHASKSTPNEGAAKKFSTSAAAISAWKRGELELSDKVEIEHEKTASDVDLAQVLSLLLSE